jgi:nucleolar protein 6
VRLLTPKVTRTGATVAKSKGCAFLEFSTRPALQAALRLHQSELDGRRINVELTAGGGGKGDARLTKLKARNKELSTQRTRRSHKAASERGESTALQESLQPQRFSTTSGEGDVPHAKRTWTVSDEDHGGENRGGKKTKKKRGARTKGWGTGVNALPVG